MLKFKFLAKIFHRLKKIQKLLESDAQNNSKLDLFFKLHGNRYAVSGRTSGVLSSAVARLNWAIPTLLA